MNEKNPKKGLSLYEAAREAGVTFSKEWVPVSKIVHANNLNFRYLEWGNPNNPIILMLHGFAQQAHSWDFVALSFADRYRIIALDQRGHGDSDWAVDGDYTPDAQEKDIAAIVKKLDLKDIILFGLSMGGRNAFTYAAKNPEQIKGLIVVDSAPEIISKGTKNIKNFIEQEDELDSIDAFVDRVIKYNPRRDPVQIRGSIVNNLRELPNGKWTWKYDKILRSKDRFGAHSSAETSKLLWSYLEKLKCPTLVVRGDQSDMVATDVADQMCDAIPNSKLAIIKNAGHLVTGDNPSGFESAVSKFIDTI
mgnify:FL=1